MQLLDIHEPGQTPLPHQQEKAIGIDLGTTHSLVAYVVDDVPKIIPNVLGRAITPSVVAYNDTTLMSVGDLAKDYIGQKNCHVISSIKRLMGRGVKDIRKISGTLPFNVVSSDETDSMVRLQVGEKQRSPVEISADILRNLKKQAEDALEETVSKAVITVPAYFDDAARQATKDAAKLAGLEVLRLVNEPTAAALAYGLDTGAEGIYAIYDLGGGTFDISLLKMEKGVFQVLATGGDAALGGDDFDHEVAELFLWHYKKHYHKIPKLTADELKPILAVSRSAKEYLSDHEEGTFDITVEGVDMSVTLTRDDINRAINAMVNKTIDIADIVLDDADITPDDIKGVVLVGGSTRVPLVKEKVAEFFDKAPLDNVNPDEVVALGAATQAHTLTGGSDNILLDVLPLSLGMETMGGIVEKVIHRNSPIPIAATQEFTTYQDGQTGMQFHVVQGEREMAVQCRSLARFELTGIPPMTAGAARIKVTFSVDADGVLSVSAEETATHIKQDVQVKPSYGLDNKEIEQMLRESMQHAKEDMALRLLTETCIETERSILALHEALEADGYLLSETERETLEKQIALTQDAIRRKEREVIITQADILERHAEKFAAKRMDKHIGEALQGKAVDTLEETLDA